MHYHHTLLFTREIYLLIKLNIEFSIYNRIMDWVQNTSPPTSPNKATVRLNLSRYLRHLVITSNFYHHCCISFFLL